MIQVLYRKKLKEEKKLTAYPLPSAQSEDKTNILKKKVDWWHMTNIIKGCTMPVISYTILLFIIAENKLIVFDSTSRMSRI